MGLIWGIWHFPIILSGVHTYPPTAAGLALCLLFFVLTGLVFGYAVIKTHSIWVACFMHGVMNSLYPFVVTYLVRPSDKAFSLDPGRSRVEAPARRRATRQPVDCTGRGLSSGSG